MQRLPLLETSLASLRPSTIITTDMTWMYSSATFTRKPENHPQKAKKQKKDIITRVLTTHLCRNIPNGTYPEERLIDGAIGAVEDAPDGTTVPIGLESSLDFDSSWPLINPQKTVLFQVDDEHYEANYTFSGFWNSEYSVSVIYGPHLSS